MNLLSQKIMGRCTARARHVLGRIEAGKNRQPGPRELLAATLEESGSLAANVLASHDLALFNVQRSRVERPDRDGQKQMAPSDALKRVLKKSVRIAAEHGSRHLGTEHILASLLEESDIRKLIAKKISRGQFENLRVQLDSLLMHTANPPTLGSIVDPLRSDILSNENQYFSADSKRNQNKKSSGRPRKSMVGTVKEQKRQKSSALDYFTEDLVEVARAGELDPLIGRDKEIERVIGILSRRGKNNPVLIGEAGVGKTAIVHGLAQRILKNQVPTHLAGRRLLALDLGLLIAGTVFRGEFEGRLKDVIGEAEDEGAILFIDELHTIVGAGAAQGSLDAANMLKPAIVRGSFQIIGATTTEEYRKSIEKDSAFERRFQAVVVNEPTPQETIKILRGLKKEFEDYHEIKIEDEAVEKTVWLAERFIMGRSFPDKALDVLDEAAGQLRARRGRSGERANSILVLESDIGELSEQKEDAIGEENYEEALLLKKQEDNLKKKLRSSARKSGKKLARPAVDVLGVEGIERAVSQMTGIDLEKITRPEKKKLLGLEKRIARHIVGQDHAISAVAASLRRSRSGIKDTKRPIGSFLFVGPSGVGKSELAKVLANTFFEDPASFFKLDMSEFSESHTVSKLLGAPAGYVGYDETGTFVDFVRRRPYSLILFDEIEKAHSHVQNILLQILEDGELTDARGARAGFGNSLVILTSNTGSFGAGAGSKTIGFEPSGKKSGGQKTTDDACSYLRPEIVSRLDDVIRFNSLGKREIQKIVRLELKKLQARIEEQQNSLRLEYTPKAIQFIAERSSSPRHGARKVRAQVQKLVEEPLAQKLIAGELTQKQKVTLDAAKAELSWKSSAS